MIGNDVIHDATALMYVVLSKAETRMPCDELTGTIIFNAIGDVSHKPISL
jgi:hypothetical protein